MYICMYICTYVHMYICIYVHMHIIMYVYTYICIYVCMYICTFIGVIPAGIRTSVLSYRVFNKVRFIQGIYIYMGVIQEILPCVI